MPWPIPSDEPRGHAELRRHYDIETALAARLRDASRRERRGLYGEVYDEFFRRVDLPRPDGEARRQVVALEARAIEPLLGEDDDFLEIGAGDCALALHLAARARRVYAVEASAKAAAGLEAPANFELVICDGIPLPGASADAAYSCHCLEHLHPEDARVHAAEVLRVLRPGGRYLCATPRRLWGPHDVSRCVDDVPTGLRRREYAHGERAKLFRRAGFRQAGVLRSGSRPSFPVWPYGLVEGLLDRLPARPRRRLMASLLRWRRPPFRPLEQVKVVAWR